MERIRRTARNRLGGGDVGLHRGLNMVAQAASGAKSPREAMREAQRLARRYYRLP
jgi:hypothetical protein